MIIVGDSAFTHTPKTAGTSITEVLLKYGKRLKGDFPHPAHVPWRYLDNPDDYFKFCFIRNPWDRSLSQYMDWRRRKKVSFETFCKAGSYTDLIYPNTRAAEVGIHNFYDFVHDDSGKLIPDRIYKYENLLSVWPEIQWRFGITDMPRHLNGTNHGHYREYYTPATRSLIADKYAWTIDTFGYTY